MAIKMMAAEIWVKKKKKMVDKIYVVKINYVCMYLNNL